MLRNVTQHNLIARNPRIATSPWIRARGMIARRFEKIDAMILPRCRSIHTCFMSQALDVIFVDAEGRVVALEPGVSPWTFRVGPSRAFSVIELPPGAISDRMIRLGDTLSWE